MQSSEDEAEEATTDDEMAVHPITNLHTNFCRIQTLGRGDFLAVFFQTIIYHYHSWTHGIHYKDVTRENLVYHTNIRGEKYGILVGWDVPTESTPEHSGLKYKVGAVPYLASDLLSEDGFRGGIIADDYRHFLEAFIWIIAFTFTCCAENGKVVAGEMPLRLTNNCSDMRRQKQNLSSDRCNTMPSPYWDREWPVAMCALGYLLEQQNKRNRNSRSDELDRPRKDRPAELLHRFADKMDGSACIVTGFLERGREVRFIIRAFVRLAWEITKDSDVKTL